MKPLYIPIGAKRAKGYCFKCGITIFNKLSFNYFPQRSHLFASGYCEKCGAFKCNIDVWADDIIPETEGAEQ